MKRIYRDSSHCNECSLRDERWSPLPVPDEKGDEFGKGGVLLLGEAPGYNEQQQLHPFAGESGRWLEWLFASLGAEREWFYFTNTVADRPPENRNPTKTEMEFHRPLFDASLEEEKPGIIVALGAVPAKFLTGKDGIKKRRGQLQLYNKVPVVLTYHPAYLMRTHNKVDSDAVRADLLWACQLASQFANNQQPQMTFTGF